MIAFDTDNHILRDKFASALDGLKKNVRTLHPAHAPVLIEGGDYQGIWLECGPHEGLVYSVVDPEVAKSNHRIFFELQRADGYLPYNVRPERTGTGQIQMVVPIAATALELATLTADQELLETAYKACGAWDDWLARHRNTRGAGLCEAFCEFDTGHDNSPRWHGLPKQCPDQDARICPREGKLPYLAPDLSATLYGGRVAMAGMAAVLGRGGEESMWLESAERTRAAILRHCFDEEDLCFYDRDREDHFVKVKGDALTRVLGEHVVDQELFDEIYARHIHNPQSFWTPYPLPSIAIDDPAFVQDIPDNSWGGASQALTALRAPRWFDHYGKHADLAHLMRRWVSAIVASGGFMQQMNPWTGEFSTSGDYSPAMCVLLDFVARLHGVHRLEETLEWNCALPEDSTYSRFSRTLASAPAELETRLDLSTGRLNGTEVFALQGRCRVITDLQGNVSALIGIESWPTRVILSTANSRVECDLGTDQVVAIAKG